MAITAVEIVQTNIVGDCDLLAIHSPLIFLANATYNTAPPDNLYLFIYDKDDVLLGSYKSLPNRDISPTVRQFRFRADQVLRQWLRPMEDFTQADNTLIEVPDMTKQFKIKFSNESTVDAGYCTKTGSVEGYTFPAPYMFATNVVVDGLSKPVRTILQAGTTLTDEETVTLIRNLYNASFPGLLGTKIDIYVSATGYTIRNNTSSKADTITMQSLGSIYTIEEFPRAEAADSITFEAVSAASQFGETESKQSLFNNESQCITGIKGKWAYAYFYDSVGTGVITVSEVGSANYEMVATNEGTLTDLTATQESASVVKFSKDVSGTGNVAFSAEGNFSKIEIKIDEIIGSFSGSTNKLEMTFLNNGINVVDLDALGVGTHTRNLNTAYPTSALKVHVVGDIEETKSISIDFIRLTGTQNVCNG